MTATMGTQTVTGWHFAGPKLRDGRPLPKKGDVLRHDGGVVPCSSGLHASEKARDALAYAPGAMVARVRLSGTVIAHNGDKYAASERENLSDYLDATRVLHEFACWCATNALDGEERSTRKVDPRSRAAISTKLAWLDGKATDKELAAAWAAASAAARDAASAAARDAAWAAASAAARDAAWAAARDAAWEASREAARDAAWEASREAARDAAWEASREAARDAAWEAASAAAKDAAWEAASAAARAAAWEAAWDAQEIELTRLLTALVEGR